MKTIFCLLVFFFGLMIGDVANSFSISPGKILLTIDPGSSKTVAINIKNTENQDLYFVGKVLGVRQDNNGRPVFLSNYIAAESWVVPQSKILIKKDATDNFIFTLSVPKNTPAGSYFLGLAIAQDLFSSGVGLTGQIVSILNLQISGDVSEELVINKWDFNKAKSNSNHFIFDLNLDNKSKVEVDLTGEIIVYNWRNNVAAGGPEYLGNTMLPNTGRFLKPQVKMDNNFRFSPYYTAKINIKYGRLGLLISSEAVILNWKVIGVGLGLFLFIILGGILLIKTRKKRV